jgi:hypothetical protein
LRPRSPGKWRAAERTVAKHGIDEALLSGAITIKNLAGQINVVIHAVGILVAPPHLFARDERVESVCLELATSAISTIW